MRHLTAQQFSAFLDGALTGVSHELVSRHLGSCPDCSDRYARWRAADETLRRALLWEPDERTLEAWSSRVELVLMAEREGLPSPDLAAPSPTLVAPTQEARMDKLRALLEGVQRRRERDAREDEAASAGPPATPAPELAVTEPAEAAPAPATAARAHETSPAEPAPAAPEPAPEPPAAPGPVPEPIAEEALAEEVLASGPLAVEPVGEAPAYEPPATAPVASAPAAREPAPVAAEHSREARPTGFASSARTLAPASAPVDWPSPRRARPLEPATARPRARVRRRIVVARSLAGALGTLVVLVLASPFLPDVIRIPVPDEWRLRIPRVEFVRHVEHAASPSPAPDPRTALATHEPAAPERVPEPATAASARESAPRSAPAGEPAPAPASREPATGGGAPSSVLTAVAPGEPAADLPRAPEARAGEPPARAHEPTARETRRTAPRTLPPAARSRATAEPTRREPPASRALAAAPVPAAGARASNATGSPPPPRPSPTAPSPGGSLASAPSPGGSPPSATPPAASPAAPPTGGPASAPTRASGAERPRTEPPAAPAPAATAAPAGDEQWPLLCGQVLDENGGPIAGAKVELRSPALAVRTDRHGRFCVSCPPGTRLLRVEAAGYVVVTRSVELGGATVETRITLAAAP